MIESGPESEPKPEPKGHPPYSDEFEISLRFFGNEILGFALRSSSKAKNWVFFGIMTIVATALVLSIVGPIASDLINSTQG